MKNIHPEVEVLFVSSSQEDAENCYKFLEKSGHMDEFFIIKPKYYISGMGDTKLDARENMIVVFHTDCKEDFEKIRPDIMHFNNCKYRCIFSNKEDCRHWVNDLGDHGMRVLIGMKEDSMNSFKELVVFFIKSHGGWKEPHHEEYKHKEHNVIPEQKLDKPLQDESKQAPKDDAVV